jgi:hypothetical protein
LIPDRQEVESELKSLIDAFPKVGKIRVRGEVTGHEFVDDDTGEPHLAFEAEIEIPKLCRFAALVQDIDYSAPIWANVLALSVAAYTYVP